MKDPVITQQISPVIQTKSDKSDGLRDFPNFQNAFALARNFDERESTHKKKQQFLKSYSRILGSITAACKTAKITRDTYYRWVKDDIKFSDAIKQIDEWTNDWVQDKLMESIAEGNIRSIIFYLKSRHTDYMPKQVVIQQETRTLEDLLDEFNDKE
jgi:hypothetical protein